MKKKFIVVKGYCGLGNRIEIILQSILLSQITQRVLFIDWSDGMYSQGRKNIFYDYFSLKGVDYVTECPKSRSVYPSIWKNKLSLSIEELRHVYLKKRLFKTEIPLSYEREDWLRTLHRPEKILVVWGFCQFVELFYPYFTGPTSQFSQMGPDTIMRFLLLHNLILNQRIQDNVLQFKKERFGEKMLGVHVRYTDRKAPMHLYDQALDSALSYMPHATIFLSTDNKKIISKFAQRSNRVVHINKDFSSAEGTALHYSSALNKTQLLEDALTEIYLLASCDSLVYSSRSSFSMAPRCLIQKAEGSHFNTETLRSRVSVIIPVRDLKKMSGLIKCLNAFKIQDCNKDFIEIIVVFCCENQGNINDLKEYGDYFKIIFHNISHNNLADLLNEGVRIAAGDIIACIDPDYTPLGSWLSKGVERLRSSPVCGFIQGRVVNPERGAHRNLPLVQNYQNLFYHMWKNKRHQNHYTEFVTRYDFSFGLNFFTYKHVIEDVGLFDPRFDIWSVQKWFQRFDHYTDYSFVYDADVHVQTGVRDVNLREFCKDNLVQMSENYNLYSPHLVLKDLFREIYRSLEDIQYILFRRREINVKKKIRFISVLMVIICLRFFKGMFLISLSDREDIE